MENPSHVSADKLKIKDEYVCWIDIMGTRNIMSESIQKATNFILRFHSCIVDVKNKHATAQFYPLMDGIFITAPNAETITKIIDEIFQCMALLFIQAGENDHRFIIKGALAYGQIANGNSIDDSVCPTIAQKQNELYRNTLLIGMPMIQANSSEKTAPPFGIYIHESARKYKLLQGKYYQWKIGNVVNKDCLRDKILKYFDWCEDFIQYQEMDKEKIKTYKQMTKEYFGKMSEKDNNTPPRDSK